jgi:hypothetical protein
MVVEPAPTAVTGTPTVTLFAGTVTLDGALATPGLSDVIVSVSGLGEDADNVNVTFTVLPRLIVWLPGPVRLPATLTLWLAPVNPVADALTVTTPKATPVTCGCEFGAVEPAGIKTLAGLIVNLEVSLLDSAIETPPDGAAAVRNTGSDAELPGATTMPAPSVMPAAAVTVTLAVAGVTFGALAVAVIVADPAAPAVTGTLTVVAPAGILALPATPATPGLLDASVTLSPPAGAAEESASVNWFAPGPLNVTVDGEKLSAPDTCTVWLADVYPDADALIVADPKLTPVTCGCEAGVTDPAPINTLSGATDTFEASLLLNVTVTPPAGAGVESVTGKATDWLVPSDTPPGSPMLPGALAVFVSVNPAVPPNPATDAITWYVPVSPFAVSVCDRATPDASVVDVSMPPANAALAPLPGAVNVTTAPPTGFDAASRTVTASGSPKGVFTPVVCGVPLVAVIDAGPDPPDPTTMVVVTSAIYGGAPTCRIAVPGAFPHTTTTATVKLLPSP